MHTHGVSTANQHHITSQNTASVQSACMGTGALLQSGPTKYSTNNKHTSCKSQVCALTLAPTQRLRGGPNQARPGSTLTGPKESLYNSTILAPKQLDRDK